MKLTIGIARKGNQAVSLGATFSSLNAHGPFDINPETFARIGLPDGELTVGKVVLHLRNDIKPGEMISCTCSRRGTSPGEMLLLEFLDGDESLIGGLAADTRIDAGHLRGVIGGRESVTREDAQKLSAHFGNSAVFWTNLQRMHDEGIQTGKPIVP